MTSGGTEVGVEPNDVEQQGSAVVGNSAVEAAEQVNAVEAAEQVNAGTQNAGTQNAGTLEINTSEAASGGNTVWQVPSWMAVPLLITAGLALLQLVLLQVGPVALAMAERNGLGLRVQRTFQFLDEVSAVSALACMYVLTLSLLRDKDALSPARRVVTSFFAGFYLPTLGLLLLLPLPLGVRLVLPGLGTGFGFALFLSELGWNAARGLRKIRWAATGLLAVGTFFVTIVMYVVRPISDEPLPEPWATMTFWFRHVGEVLWLGTPFLFLGTASSVGVKRVPRWLAASLAALLVLTLLIGAQRLHYLLSPRMSLIYYAAFRLAALPESRLFVYGVMIILLCASSVWAITSGNLHLATALCLWMTAGYCPRAPLKLLLWTLSLLLLAGLEMKRSGLAPRGRPGEPFLASPTT